MFPGTGYTLPHVTINYLDNIIHAETLYQQLSLIALGLIFNKPSFVTGERKEKTGQ
jgi:hypothetical protein